MYTKERLSQKSLQSKLFTYALMAAAALLLPACEEEDAAVPDNSIANYQLKAASFNIRFDNPDDGANNWHNRKEAVVAFLEAENMHIVGMQEVLDNQFRYLKNKLRAYGTVGVGREDGVSKGEYAPVFYRKDAFVVRDSGTFWLSTTPQEPSVGWDAALERICTYAILEDQRNGREVHFYNTHFDHVGENARVNSARLIMDSIAAKSAGHWVILSGDLNVEPNATAYERVVQTGLQDSYEESKIRLGPVGTFNGFNPNGNYQRRIDYVFVRGFSVELYETNNLSYNANFLSDHFPVITLLEYRPL
jgi:endonuclease/exonuclease/phosphatase family metal-dependent hydrolase